MHESECNIAAFRHIPQEPAKAPQKTHDEFQRRRRRQVIKSGQLYLVAARINDQDDLRVHLINLPIELEHLNGLLKAARIKIWKRDAMGKYTVLVTTSDTTMQ